MGSKQYNLGLCLLRMIMCYIVILCHFGDGKDAHGIANIFFVLKSEAVPVFMLLAFFLTKNIYASREKYQLVYRIRRLIYPQIGWTVIYFLFYFLVELMFEIDKSIGIAQFLWQLFTGHCPDLNPTMWYQIVLIVITIAFGGIFYFCSLKRAMVLIIILAWISLFLQYSEINYKLFSGLRYELTSLGRIAEVIPYATVGIFMGHYEIKKNWKKILCVASGLIMISFFVPSIHGFGYSGILRIGIAIILVTLFYLLPFEKIAEKYKKIILQLSKYTLGIYCMHRLVGNVIDKIILRCNIEIHSCVLCLIIYIICYGIARVMTKMPIKLFKTIVE